MRILLIEDEERIASFVVKGLSAHGYEVEHAGTGEDGLRHAARADLVILDLGLPDIDGLDVLRMLRAASRETQVIVLTARGELADRVEGLERGADDYLTKPFAFEELLARIRARVRTLEQVDRRMLRHGPLTMDLLARRVTLGGDEVALSGREFELLEALLREPGRPLGKGELLSRVWGLEFDPRSNLVEVYVRYLRRKLGATAIETVRGRGYRLADPD